MSDATSVAAAQDNSCACSASPTEGDDPHVRRGTFSNSPKSIKDKMVADLRAGNCSRWRADCWAIAIETAMMVLEELTTEMPA